MSTKSNSLKDSSPKTAVLIGGGIMSATLALLLKKLDPSIEITIYELLDQVANESSGAMNNAGTGHSGYCELNYTPQKKDGSVDVKKAIEVAHDFVISKEFWAYCVKEGYVKNPQDFIRTTPHYSFVFNKDTNFLRKRYLRLKKHPLFQNLQYSSDFETLNSWFPLIMKGRNDKESFAATKMVEGTDVNFEILTKNLLLTMIERKEVNLKLSHLVKDIVQNKEPNKKSWTLEVKDLKNNNTFIQEADFVFIGAGGGSILLLEKSKIKEAANYGGFPVGGQWLVCDNQQVIDQHMAKVYGQAKVNAPPMSVPHLDTRIIDGKKRLLFGPFAVFSTKFLKHGSYLDLFKSIQVNNLGFISQAGFKNINLTKYLVEQASLTKKDKMKELREFIVDAKDEDWNIEDAGQRVQVIKKDQDKGGVLQFGTEVVNNKEGSISALLGASPGASTSVSVMLKVIEHSLFKDQYQADPEWNLKLRQMVPSLFIDKKDKNKVLEAKDIADKILKLS